MDQTGVRCTECWNGGCLSSEHFNKSPESFWIRSLNLLKIIELCLSEFSYNSVSAEFVFQKFVLVTSGLIGFEQRISRLHGFTDARPDPREMFSGRQDLLGETFTDYTTEHIMPSCPALVNIEPAKQAIPINSIKHIAGFCTITE